MTAEAKDTHRSWLPLINWLLAVAGIAMTAGFINTASELSLRPRIYPGMMLLTAGPYVLLGLACHANRRSAKGRTAGFVLSLILLIVPTCVYFLAMGHGDCAFIYLSVPFFMWVYSGTTAVLTAIDWIRNRLSKRKESRREMIHEH